MTTPRRDFVRLSILGSVSASLPGCSSAPKALTIPGDGGLSLSLAQNPALAEIGGQVSVMHEDGRVLVARLDGATVSAVDQRCPHRGCSIGWSREDSGFVCPCHGSTFEADGQLRTGPARSGLSQYPTRFDGERVFVELPK